MATNTIIIESNRKIAYKDELDAITVADIGNVQRQDRIPNNRWTTHIPAGLEIDVGDQLNLEAAMINSVGGGDGVIEFTGVGGDNGTDLQMDMTVDYYITNRHQFNFNLPKFGTKISYRVYNNLFGSPDFVGESGPPLPAGTDPETAARQRYTQFKQSYPLEGLQGYAITVGPSSAAPAPAELTNGSFSMGAYGSSEASPLRYFYSKDWNGPYLGDTPGGGGLLPTPTTYTTYATFSKDVKLTVPQGFSTPAAIGERLTSQLHARDGNADNWDFSTVAPTQFFLDSVLKQRPLPGVTDQAYLTIPTCSGALLYGRQTGDWTAKLNNEVGFQEGDGYVPVQARKIFWSNMLCANPDEVAACDALKVLMERPDLSATIATVAGAGGDLTPYSLDTGATQQYSSAGKPVGELGNRMCINQTDLPFVKLTGLSWAQSNTQISTHVIPPDPATPIEWACLNLESNHGVVSNVVWNSVTTGIMNTAFDAFHSCDEDTGIIDVKNPEYLNKFYVKWKIGRKDDEATFNAIEQQHYLTNASLYHVKDAAPVNPIFAREVWANTGGALTPVPTATQNCSYILKPTRFPPDSTQTENRPCLPGLIANGTNYDYNIYFKYYADPTWTVEKAQAGTLGIHGIDTVTQDFTTIHPLGMEAQRKVWAQMGESAGVTRYGYIPVYKLSGTVAQRSVPYICFVTQKSVNPNNGYPIPRPAFGEFMGLSPSLNDNLFAKPVNIQKYTDNTNGYQQTTYNDTVDYYPFCHIGANDPAIQFGDNGRFQISQFHTPIRAGNGTFNRPTYPANQEPETNIMSVSDFEANISGVRAPSLIYKDLAHPAAWVLGGEGAMYAFTATPTNVSKFTLNNNVYKYWVPTSISTWNVYTTDPPVSNAPTTMTAINIVGNGRGIRIYEAGGHTDITATSDVPLIPNEVQPASFTEIGSTATGNNSVMSTQSGIAITQLSNYTQDLLSKNIIENYNTRAYQNTLLFKLGFGLEQLLPVFGLAQNDFNRGNFNQYLGTNQPAGLKLVNMVKPVTTNAYVSSAIIPSLVKGAGYIEDSAGHVVSRPLIPMPLLGGLGDLGSNTNAESDVLNAVRMPVKLDYPYLVVYTDIVRDAQYLGGATGHQKLSAIAYITRNYASGDYFYGFTTTWDYTADSNYVITDITTDIRLPDGSPAPLDDNSSVIYKVIKQKQMPLNPAMLPKILKENAKK